ncbi:IS1595 family transposase [Parasphingopyxis sp.]|uniref:IS1595 family transposase n=1 Tax=Parasphingopyxis sp. TaxID=1920299 RepID=UPI00262FC766|nr:IS1595 family transposase [Parasphingopyxis sp.]
MKLDNPIFKDAEKAREHLEAINWPHGPVCPHCGETKNVTRLKGKSHRPGLIQCNTCTKNFTVTVGTVFERSKVPLNKWLLATYLLSSSKKGMSAKQIERMLGVTYKTAWFMCHRIREAMRDTNTTPMGSGGGAVEADETFIGKEPGKKTKSGYFHKMKVLSLVDRDTGRSKSMVVDSLKAPDIAPIVFENVSREAKLMTDEASHYQAIGFQYANHESVNHSKGEYGRGIVHTNTIEGYFSIFKRGMKGIYQHCDKAHLHRYLAEFDFRYSNREALGVNDGERTDRVLAGIRGKRLTYRRTDKAALA